MKWWWSICLQTATNQECLMQSLHAEAGHPMCHNKTENIILPVVCEFLRGIYRIVKSRTLGWTELIFPSIQQGERCVHADLWVSTGGSRGESITSDQPQLGHCANSCHMFITVFWASITQASLESGILKVPVLREGNFVLQGLLHYSAFSAYLWFSPEKNKWPWGGGGDVIF